MAVLGRIGLGIRFLGGFTVLAGIAILAGAVAAGAARRGREVALLKTLGMTRRGVAAAFAVEYALVGLVAGVIGAGGGALLAWRVLTEGFEMSWRFQPAAVGAAVAGTALLTVLAGLAASWRALERRPIEVLRADNVTSYRARARVRAGAPFAGCFSREPARALKTAGGWRAPALRCARRRSWTASGVAGACEELPGRSTPRTAS